MILNKMQEHKINVYKHLDRQTVADVCAATGTSVAVTSFDEDRRAPGCRASGEAGQTDEDEEAEEAVLESVPVSPALDEISSSGSRASNTEDGAQLSYSESRPGELEDHDWDEDSDVQQGDEIPEDDQDVESMSHTPT